MRVWRNHNTYFIDCEKCGSRGTHPVKTKLRASPELQRLVDGHRDSVFGMRRRFNETIAGLVGQVQRKTLSKEEAAVKIKALHQDLVTDVFAAEAAMPDPSFGTTEIAKSCPWCGQGDSEVVVEKIPDGVLEPAWDGAKEDAA